MNIDDSYTIYVYGVDQKLDMAQSGTTSPRKKQV